MTFSRFTFVSLNCDDSFALIRDLNKKEPFHCVAVRLQSENARVDTIEHRFVLVRAAETINIVQAFHRADMGLMRATSVTEITTNSVLETLRIICDKNADDKQFASAYAQLCGLDNVAVSRIMERLDRNSIEPVVIAMSFQGCSDNVEQFVMQYREASGDALKNDPLTRESFTMLSVRELKQMLNNRRIKYDGCVEKVELVELLLK